MEIMRKAEDCSFLERGNQVAKSSTRFLHNQRNDSRTSKREILKQSGRQTSPWQRTPTKRRLVNFMPERWQEPGMILPTYDGIMSATTSIHKDIETGQQIDNLAQERRKSKTSPEKAHRDTLQGRARRQRTRDTLQNNNKTLGRLIDNRFNILSELSETDGERSNTDLESVKNDNSSEVDKQMTTMKKTSKKKITSTEVPHRTGHVKRKDKNTMKQRNTLKSDSSDTTEEEEEINVLSDTEISSTKNKNRTMKIYLQDFKILA